MITPKEKAKELIKKFIEIDINTIECGHWMCIEGAKYCALISIDELELYRNQIEKEYNEDLYHAYGQEEYWQEVKQEILQYNVKQPHTQ